MNSAVKTVLATAVVVAIGAGLYFGLKSFAEPAAAPDTSAAQAPAAPQQQGFDLGGGKTAKPAQMPWPATSAPAAQAPDAQAAAPADSNAQMSPPAPAQVPAAQENPAQAANSTASSGESQDAALAAMAGMSKMNLGGNGNAKK